MYKNVKSIKVNSSAITIGLVGAIISAIVSMAAVPLLLLGFEVEISFNYIFNFSADNNGGKLLLLLINPILVFGATYFTTAIVCISYNLVSKFTGGVSYSLSGP